MNQLIKGTKGVITSYRRSRHRIHPRQILCKFDGYDSHKTAAKLIGHEVEWVSKTGKCIRGVITRLHGKNGVVRVLLKKKGVPGQALGQKVIIIK
ncbi:MAG: 50S ribosomal protein L35ae [Promethearchaeota archaeon]